MIEPIRKKESKTISQINKVDVKMVEDTKLDSAKRTQDARDIIAKMILLASKNGRPSKKEEEYENAA
jgi:hypothetical protein